MQEATRARPKLSQCIDPPIDHLCTTCNVLNQSLASLLVFAIDTATGSRDSLADRATSLASLPHRQPCSDYAHPHRSLLVTFLQRFLCCLSRMANVSSRIAPSWVILCCKNALSSSRLAYTSRDYLFA